MFQDIEPHQLDARYEPKSLKQTDFVVLVNQRKILMLNQKAELLTPTVAELTATYDLPLTEANYLLSIEGHNFFTFDVELVEAGNFTYESITVLRG
ncbi:hypothetical protein [Secundilactobacillus oryzae]|nr:hypothetical protein [Secundilactobacillus oryzae]